MTSAHCSLNQVQVILPLQLPKLLGLQVCICGQFFVLFIEMVFHHVGQAGLELLTPNEPTHLSLPKCRDYRHERATTPGLHMNYFF